MRTTLYGDDQSEPVAETCAQLTQEFFKGDTLRLFIMCLPKLDFGVMNHFSLLRLYGHDFCCLVSPFRLPPPTPKEKKDTSSRKGGEGKDFCLLAGSGSSQLSGIYSYFPVVYR